MARRKNVKRIDPRYFLNETVDRKEEGSALEEGSRRFKEKFAAAGARKDRKAAQDKAKAAEFQRRMAGGKAAEEDPWAGQASLAHLGRSLGMSATPEERKKYDAESAKIQARLKATRTPEEEEAQTRFESQEDELEEGFGTALRGLAGAGKAAVGKLAGHGAAAGEVQQKKQIERLVADMLKTAGPELTAQALQRILAPIQAQVKKKKEEF